MPAQQNRPSSHTTSSSSGGWNSRRVAVSALFCALAIVASFIEIPLFPPAPYLKYDPSGIVGLVAGLAFGPAVGSCVAALPWVIHLFVEQFGAVMGMACSLAAVLPASLVYRRRHTRAGAAAGLALGSVVAIVVAVAGNIVITPLYSGVPVDAVVALIVPVLLPFNLIKVVLNDVVCWLAYKPVSDMVGR